MGYRANTVKVQREYGGTPFCDWENFTMTFLPAFEEAGFEFNGDDEETFYEIEKSKLQEFVKTVPSNDEPSISTEHTNRELKYELQVAIDETKYDYVQLEWF